MNTSISAVILRSSIVLGILLQFLGLFMRLDAVGVVGSVMVSTGLFGLASRPSTRAIFIFCAITTIVLWTVFKVYILMFPMGQMLIYYGILSQQKSMQSKE